MKLVRFEHQQAVSVGVDRGDSIIDLNALLDGRLEGGRRRGSMRGFLEFCADSAAGEVLNRAMASAVGDSAAGALVRPKAECRLLAPIDDPGKIICLGLNYADHAAEQGKSAPETPIVFAKFASCIIGPGDTVELPARYTQQADYEVELAVVIGRRGKEIDEQEAYSYVAGYTILNDVTARDFQAADRQWVRGKSCDTFAPLGPCIVTADSLADPHALRLEMRLNGQVMQSSTTAQMVFKIPFLLAYLSRCLTLEPGDIISTGTPPGVGVFRKPPVFLKTGDRMEAEIEGIGILGNEVR